MCIIIFFDNINYYMCKIICKRIITVTIFIVCNNTKCYCYWSLLNVSSLPYIYNICIIYTFPMNKTTSSHKVLARPDLPILSGVWSSSGTSKGIHAPLRLDVFLRMFVGGGRRIFPQKSHRYSIRIFGFRYVNIVYNRGISSFKGPIPDRWAIDGHTVTNQKWVASQRCRGAIRDWVRQMMFSFIDWSTAFLCHGQRFHLMKNMGAAINPLIRILFVYIYIALYIIYIYMCIIKKNI